MRAAVFYGPRDIRIEDIPEPEPGPGQVVIEVSRNGICGSDLHTYVGSDTGGAAMHVPGVALGHEFAGIVREVGHGVDDLSVGTAVAIAPIEYCGTCYSCVHGWHNMCRRLSLYGGYREPLHGGLAGRVCVSRRAAFRLPDGLGPIEAALTEPMAVAVHAVRRAPFTFGATVLVLGAGPIGLAILQAARAGGASVLIVSETSAARAAAAARFGASLVVDPREQPIVRAVREVVRDGVDVVFDTTGVHAAFNDGISALHPRGTMVSVAGWQEHARLDMGRAMAKEVEVRFVITYEPQVDFPIAMDLLASGAFDAAAMITDHIPLDAVIDQGLEELLNHPDRHIKILVDPHA